MTPPTGASAVAIGHGCLRLRPADADDEAFLQHLFKSIRAAQFAAANLPAETLAAMLDQQYRAQRAGYAAQYPDAESLIIEHRGAAVGRLLLHADALRWRIVDIALLPDAQGRGIGTDLIDAVARSAADAAALELQLAVRSGNIAARRLYARLGFAEIRDDGAYVAMTRLLPGTVTAAMRSP